MRLANPASAAAAAEFIAIVTVAVTPAPPMRCSHYRTIAPLRPPMALAVAAW